MTPMRFGDDGQVFSTTVPEDGSIPSSAHARTEPFARRNLIAAAVLAVGYFAGVQVGLALTFVPNPVSTLWPPNAILLAALLLMPPRVWPLLIAAVFPAHVLAETLLGVPLTMSLCWFVSNVAEALLGAAIMLRYLGAAPRFDRVRDLSVFLFAGVLVAPLLSSFLDASFVALVGWRYTDYWQVWRMRLFSNSLAALTLVPLIVIWFQRGIRSLRAVDLRQYAETSGMLICISVVSVLVFQRSHSPEASAVLMYAPLPLLMWAAIRNGVSTVSLCVAIVAMVAIFGVLSGRGPFNASAPADAAMAVQTFLIIAEASLMLLAASLAELRDARSASRRQEESLTLALGAARMGTWDWDIGRDRVAWRLGQAGAMRTRLHEAPLAKVLKRVHADDRETVRRTLQHALTKAEVQEIECRFMNRDGRPEWITSRGKVISDAHGNPQRMTGVYVDTTERKLQELQMRAHREQLAYLSRVALLGELSGALAHELNQPLAAILLNAQAASDEIDKPSPDLQEIGAILKDIVADDQRAGEVIRRLRALFIKGSVQTRPVAVHECIREVLALEHSHLMALKVTAHVQLATEIPPVLADWVQLQQVLLNLIVNACDAMQDNESVDRRLKIESSLAADGGVEIRVIDSGGGLADTERIFEPFFSTKDQGIGLGLAVSRTIIAAHRGRLWASQNPVRGATFHISLPAASGAVEGGAVSIGRAGRSGSAQ
jgi:two-component system sensor kinase FixL